MDLTKPLNPGSTESDTFAAGVQGNIVKGHGRLHGKLILARIREVPETSCPLVGSLAELCVQSASDQAAKAKKRKEDLAAGLPADSGPFGSILLSSEGFKALGLDPKFKKTRAVGSPLRDVLQNARAFAEGLRNRESYFSIGWSPGTKEWQSEYPKNKKKDEDKDEDGFHLLVLLADDKFDRLEERAAKVEAAIAAFGTVVHHEFGRRLVHKNVDPENPIEHFGFRDSLSGPVFVDQAFETDAWPKQVSPLSDLFVEEQFEDGKVTLPKEPNSPASYGSFVTFLKLEQNVKKFRDASKKLGAALGVAADQAAALAVGREKNGTPLIPVAGEDQNAFTYRGNGAAACPVHAHIRRMEGRGLDRPAPMARRSFVYGPERDDLLNGGEPPETGCGLLFFSYQSNLATFEDHMSRSASENGVDALLGRKVEYIGGAPVTNPDRDGRQLWSRPDGGTLRHAMYDFVTPKGGEYFFCPSMDFFRRLQKVV